MLEGLDAVPWGRLHHAYGSAEDVPALLRKLRHAPSGGRGEGSPLWHLFGNVWHQGTVYEATGHAVPFLIELAAEPLTPDRIGILQLLAAIANGSPPLAKDSINERPAREAGSATAAHDAVSKGFDTLVSIMNEDSPQIQLAAAHVLAQLPERASTVAALLRERLNAGSHEFFRAAYLLLLGQAGDRSESTIALLVAALSANDAAQRRAAGISLARLRPDPLPAAARDQILDLVCADDIGEDFVDLPWDAMAEIDPDQLLACMDAAAREQATNELIHQIETGTSTGNRVTALLQLLFAGRTRTTRWLPEELSPLQARAVRAMAVAMEGGQRIFYGHFPQWGLPDAVDGWRKLAKGEAPSVPDMTLPILGDIADPRRAVRPYSLVAGQRVHHRAFGPGTVSRVIPSGNFVRLVIQFDVEGVKTLLLPASG